MGRAAPALALAATVLGLGVQVGCHLDEIRRYRVPPLPAFDAFVYVAAAEHPTVFTLPPWGHRILTPWLVHALPVRLGLAFPLVTIGAFALAGLLLFVFLRGLGARPWAAALGVAAFALAPPVGEVVAAPFLVEPLACALLVALLAALELGFAVPVLAFLAALGVLAKEVFVLFLPVVYFARRPARGRAGAARDAAVVMGVALAAALLLRVVWTPTVRTPIPDLGPERLRLILASLRTEPGRWAAVLALGGLTPAAAAGALTARGREFARRYGWVAAVTLAQPLLVPYAIQQVVGEMNRFLLYAVPELVPLALFALDRLVRAFGAAGMRVRRSRAVALIASAGTVVVIAAPLLAVDRYRRLDLQGRRDGYYVLGFCRGTWTSARKLRDGAAVLLRLDERRFAPDRFEAELFERMRWFLRDGWGPEPHYGTSEALMRADHATLVLPCLRPAPVEITLAMAAHSDLPVSASVNGRFLGTGVVGTARSHLRFEVPAEALFRGDNLLALDAPGATAEGVQLYALTYSPLASPRSP